MMDREKVIKGLEHCASGICNECPYIYDCWTSEGIPVARDALALLKAHETVVRCYDCKYYDRRCFTCENDALLIKIDDCGCYPPFRVDDDWFCADGERRDSE